MNRTEQVALMRRFEDLAERVDSLERVLGLRDPEPVETDNAVIEGAPAELEDAGPEKPKDPPFEGILDKTGGWYDVYWGGNKINTKSLRRTEANALLDHHRQMQAGLPYSQEGMTADG